MNTQQAYINGFIKRANEYGLTSEQAIQLLKQATAADAPNPAKIHSKPINIPSPAPVRQFGMTAKGLDLAQNNIENMGELNLGRGK